MKRNSCYHVQKATICRAWDVKEATQQIAMTGRVAPQTHIYIPRVFTETVLDRFYQAYT